MLCMVSTLSPYVAVILWQTSLSDLASMIRACFGQETCLQEEIPKLEWASEKERA